MERNFRLTTGGKWDLTEFQVSYLKIENSNIRTKYDDLSLSENNGRPINKKRDSIVSKGMLRNMLSSSATQNLFFEHKLRNLRILRLFLIEVMVNQLFCFIIQTNISKFHTTII